MNTSAIDESKLAGIVLRKSGHDTQGAGMCLMEAVVYVAGGPAWVSTLLVRMGRILNNNLPDDLRQLLLPVIPDLPGTVDDGLDLERSYMALDWLVRVHLPTWLDLSEACREVAEEVRQVGRIVDMASAERAVPVVRKARQAARDAAEATAKNAAARYAARSAVWVSRDAAGAAVWAALYAMNTMNVMNTMNTMNIVNAASALNDVDAARAAARDVACVAVTGGTTDTLRPVVKALHISAIELFTRMARLGHEQPTT
jgi:hypothetical protein